MYKIYLSACGNPDFGEDPEKNIVRGKVIEDKVLEFDSIDECRVASRCFIEENALGSSNYSGGKIYEGDEYVGYVSYNGRFWDKYSKYGKAALENS